MENGKELARWEAHEAAVSALAFQPDSRVLVSVDVEGVVKVWNLDDIRRELKVLGLDWQ